MTITISKSIAIKLKLTGAKPSRAVKVGPNSLAQNCIGQYRHTNNIAGLCYRKDNK